MSYLFNEAVQFGGTGGQFSGKNKGALLTNTSASAAVVDAFVYNTLGTTYAVRMAILANQTILLPLRVWGISCGAGITGAVIS